MNINTTIRSTLAGGLVAGASVLYGQSGKPTVQQEVKSKYYEILDKDTCTLSFEEGKSVVNDAQRSSLKSLVDKMSRDSSVKKYILAAWPDKDYPASKSVELSSMDEKLAEARMDSVAKVLKDLGVKNIDDYSMAKHPTWISKVFETDESKIKGESKKEPHKSNDDFLIEKIGEQFRKLGGPGKVVVVAKH